MWVCSSANAIANVGVGGRCKETTCTKVCRQHSVAALGTAAVTWANQERQNVVMRSVCKLSGWGRCFTDEQEFVLLALLRPATGAAEACREGYLLSNSCAFWEIRGYRTSSKHNFLQL